MNNKKLINILIVFGIMFFSLATYLMMIEVVFKDEYMEKDKSRAILKEQNVLRGSIYDRNGTTLAYSKFENDVQIRYYPYDNLYSHIIGYSLDAGNKSRIENSFNADLLGDNIVSDLLNFNYSSSRKTGSDLVLTIDHNLQQKAYSLLGNQKGAIIVSNPKTGEIYAMVSKPDFNPNYSYLSKNWTTLATDDENSPFLSRATQGIYPPGSTYKIVTSAALLESGNGDFSVFDNGEYEIGGTTVKNSGGKKPNRELDLREAFTISSNVYFVTAGDKVLGETITKQYAKKFLVGENFDFDIDVSTSLFAENVTKTEAGMSAMGQGEKQGLTPLAINIVTSAIANDGSIVKPFLVKQVKSQSGIVIKNVTPKTIATPISKENADKIKEYMKDVVNEYNGTGKRAKERFRFSDIIICGKTGTAETKDAKDHAWFTGFAPFENPEIVVTIVLENAGFGGDKAAPIAGEIMNEYFKNKR